MIKVETERKRERRKRVGQFTTAKKLENCTRKKTSIFRVTEMACDIIKTVQNKIAGDSWGGGQKRSEPFSWRLFTIRNFNCLYRLEITFKSDSTDYFVQVQTVHFLQLSRLLFSFDSSIRAQTPTALNTSTNVLVRNNRVIVSTSASDISPSNVKLRSS